MLRISSNIEAFNIHRQLTKASAQQSRAMERVSSGYRINRAADDAAGLGISESMRGQIGGLAQASRNAQDAISFVQTGEGALGEIASMLQRARELAVQYHTDTLSNDDRESIQAEARQLSSEVISTLDGTQFNGEPMFGRHASTKSFQIGANDGDKIDLAVPSLRDTLGVYGTVGRALHDYDYQPQPVATTLQLVSRHLDADGEPTVTRQSYTVPPNTNVTDLQFLINGSAHLATTTTNGINGIAVWTYGYGPDNESELKGPGLTEYTQYRRSGGEWRAPAFELGATNDIAEIDSAIQAISKVRGQFGAVENRLEHRISNVATYQENLSAAESRIRDADIAQEYTTMTKASILTQAATSMLSQANQGPQLVLSLLH